MNKKVTNLKSILPSIGMLILAAYSLYAFLTTKGIGFFIYFFYIVTQPLTMIPGLALLSMFVFAVLYLRAPHENKPIPDMARNIAYVFTALIVAAFGFLVVGIIQDIVGVRCTGFFGVQSSCFESQYVGMFILLLLHPFVYLGYLVLSLLGIGSLIKNVYRRK